MSSRLHISLLSVGLAACAGQSSRPDITELEQGLNILDAEDADWGMAVAYVKGEHVVYFETRVGTMKPEIYRTVYAGDPANEMDFRFVDENGLTFYYQRGGDRFVDPTWADDINGSWAAVETYPVDEMNAKWALAQEAMAALKVDLPSGFAAHVYDAVQIVDRPAPSSDPQIKANFDKAQAQAEATGDKTFGWRWADGNQWLDSYRYTGTVGCFFWVCGYHSAVRMARGYPSVIDVGDACNHGRCWWGGGMGYGCDAYGWNSGGASIFPEENGDGNGAGTAVGGGCWTPYNWNSGGYDHLCNSDAAYEIWQAKNARWNTDRGDYYSFTWDNGGHNYACNCNNNNDCDGDWKAPGCY
jgi:hypothetical protein